MSLQENRALVPIDVPRQESGVSSDNFYDFLLGDPASLPHEHELSSRLDVSWLASHMQELDKQARKGFALSEEERTKKIEMVEGFKFIPREQKDSLLKGINKEVELERGQTMYLNREDYNTYLTGIRHGGPYSVERDLENILDANNIPVLEMHTHSTDVLPSSADYLTLTLDPYNDGGHIIRAIIVLCPRIQVLAVATRNTPSFSSWEEARQFADEVQDQFFQLKRERIIQLFQRKQAIEKVRSEAEVENFRRTIESVAHMERKLMNGPITYEELEILVHGVVEYSKAKTAELAPRLKRVQSRAERKFLEATEKTNTEGHIEGARKFGVKLYTATDFRHFQATSL